MAPNIVFIVSSCIAILSGCRSAFSKDPNESIREIRSELTRGNLALAEQKVKWQEDRKPSSACVDCASQLRLLDAEILTQQRKSQEVLNLLENDRNFPSPTLDTSVKRELFCGYAHARLGQQQLSDIELTDAEALAEGAHSSLRADVLQIQGITALRRNRFTAAQGAFRKSLEIAQASGKHYVEAGDLLDLGVLALQAERYSEALDRFSASASVAQSIDAREILERDSGNIGWTQYRMGNYEAALISLARAEQQSKSLGSVATQIDWLDRTGRCLAQLGEMKKAEQSYQSALKDARDARNDELVEDISTKLALLYLQIGNLAAAKTHMGEAIRASASTGDKFTQINLVLLQGLIASREGKNDDASRLLLDAYSEATELPSVRWNAENALAKLSASEGQERPADIWYRQSIATFETLRASVKDEELRLPFFANGDELYRDYADFLIASHEPGKALALLDLGRARTLAEGLGRSPTDARVEQTAFRPEAVARKEGATILFYSLGEEKSWLWAINARGTKLFPLPRKAEIESQVAAYQKAILRPADPVHEQNQNAIALYDALVAPAMQMIPEGSKVILIPDGVLDQLNFETLLAPGKDGRHYWIDDAMVTNANSIRLLARSRPREMPSQEKNLLLIGNAMPGGQEFETLPNAPAEVTTIENLFPAKDRMVLTQAKAVPAAYQASRPARFSYIHFVAHGTASRLSPLDSAVVLSPSLEHPDTYKLYARDIIHQPIHAELVTISACNGSGIRAYAGEGLVGLSWAFLRAGSHNVIGGLWNVDDAATLQLMDRLYTGLRKGEQPDAALRNAKLALVHSDGVHRKPLYWAAFQLYAGS